MSFQVSIAAHGSKASAVFQENAELATGLKLFLKGKGIDAEVFNIKADRPAHRPKDYVLTIARKTGMFPDVTLAVAVSGGLSSPNFTTSAIEGRNDVVSERAQEAILTFAQTLMATA